MKYLADLYVECEGDTPEEAIAHFRREIADGRGLSVGLVTFDEGADQPNEDRKEYPLLPRPRQGGR